MNVTARELSEALSSLPNYHEFPGEYYRIMLIQKTETTLRYANNMVVERSADRIIEFKKRNGEWVLHSLPDD